MLLIPLSSFISKVTWWVGASAFNLVLDPAWLSEWKLIWWPYSKLPFRYVIKPPACSELLRKWALQNSVDVPPQSGTMKPSELGPLSLLKVCVFLSARPETAAHIPRKKIIPMPSCSLNHKFEFLKDENLYFIVNIIFIVIIVNHNFFLM